MLDPNRSNSQDTQSATARQTDWPRNAIVVSIFVFGIAFLFGTNVRIFGDGDVSWHIAAGQWMITHRAIPFADPFSYTAFGKPWVAHEWLSELLMAAVFNGFGYAGIAILTALAIAFTLLIIALRLQHWMQPVEMCATLMVIALALYPLTLARPLVLAWPILALWVAELVRAREQSRLPSWYLAPLMVIWVNLHASFAVGLGLAALFGLEALLESHDRRRTFIQWSLFGTACGLAALANPHGIKGALFPLGVFTSPTVNFISEFHPTDFTDWPTFELVVFSLLSASLLRGARLAPVRLLILLTLLHLALAHMRHQSIFIIVTSLVAVPAMTRAWIAAEPPNLPLLTQLRNRLGSTTVVCAVFAALLFTICGVRLLVPIKPPNSEVNAIHAFDAIPQSLHDQRVLNEYSFGGPLILRGIKVFMDGRTDVYGDAHFIRYREIASGDPKAFAEADKQWQFCWSIFRPSDSDLLKLLDGSRDWLRIYSDNYAVIHVRRRCQ